MNLYGEISSLVWDLYGGLAALKNAARLQANSFCSLYGSNVYGMQKKCVSYEHNSMWEMEQFWRARIHVGCPLHDFLPELEF